MAIPPAPIPWHSGTHEDILARLQTRPEGLSPAEAQARLLQHGPNELESVPGPSLGALVLKQFRSPLIYMLLAAAVVSLVGESVVDAVVILAVVVLNTIVGVWQEWRAEQALEALRRLSAPLARVIRHGEAMVVAAREVVPGDILLLEAGDRVAADARVLEAHDLHIDESALTGESQPVEKLPAALPPRTPLADRTNMAWTSTPVTAGRARGIVVVTGMATVMGEIAGEVRATERTETPLQQRLASFGTTLGVVAIGLSLLIFVLGLLRGFELFDMLLFAVAAAVSAIPEGLPAVISVVLALGVQRMARRGAIIRRLPAVETLGSTTTICSDKTGTITRNAMTVARMWVGGRTFQVSGQGFAPEGAIAADGDVPTGGVDDIAAPLLPPASPATRYPTLDALLILGCLANDATLEHTGDAWKVHGDPTEGALLVVAGKGRLAPESIRAEHERLAEIPFSSKRQYMATLHGAPRGVALALVKGAPERVLAFCTHILLDGKRKRLTPALQQQVLAANEAYAEEALRVLAGAYREMPAGTDDLSHAEVERELTFIGLWGMLDPPRPEAVHAIAAAQGAGIRVMMITGDHAVTGTAIARAVGIATHGEETVTGEELDEISDADLRRRVGHIGVFARVSPGHKLRIVDALRAEGQIVAMTGDGVNDAPALKRANIGVAMGITGTEVAKEAADMVLTDDNFATIVRAVEEGRIIFANLRKVIFFLVTTNLGEILTLTAALIIGLPLPLTAVMVLWVNLVTDGLCTAPLGVEPAHGDVLTRPPRDPNEGVLDRPLLWRMGILAPLMALGTLGLFWYELTYLDASYIRAQTVAFTTLVTFQWFHALNARSARWSLFTIGFFANRWLLAGIAAAIALQLLVVYWPLAEVVFATTALSAIDWGLILLVASSIFWVDEIRKWVLRRRPASSPVPSEKG